MQTRLLVLSLAALGALALPGGVRAQAFDVTVSPSADQTGFSGNTILFNGTITNNSSTVLTAQSGNFSVTEHGQASLFDPLTDFTDNLPGPFTLDYTGDSTPTGDPTTAGVSDLFDVFIDPAKFNGLTLDPTVDYLTGTYSILDDTNTSIGSVNFTVRLQSAPAADATVPEPGTYALMVGMGLAGVSLLRRRRKFRKAS